MDRRGRAVAGPLAHGRPPLRRPLPLAALHAGSHARGLRDVLRHQVPQPRAAGGAAAAALARVRVACRARGRVRREGGLGAGQLVRGQRGGGRRGAAPARLGGAPLVAGDRRRGARLPRDRRAVRRVLVRQARGLGPGCGGVPRAADREPRRARAGQGHLHADAQPARRDRVRLHRHPVLRGPLRDRHRDRVRRPRPRLDRGARRPGRRRAASRTSRRSGRASRSGDRTPARSSPAAARTTSPSRTCRARTSRSATCRCARSG